MQGGAQLDETVERKIQELFAPLTTGFSPEMIDDRARDFLNELSTQNALAALEEFHEAIKEEGQRIRNKPVGTLEILQTTFDSALFFAGLLHGAASQVSE